MKKNLIVVMAALMTAVNALAWGQKGHDVVAYIAEQHLRPEVKTAVEAALGNHSMVYWANWLDNASNTPEYAYSKTWHYKNVDEGVAFEDMPLNPKGDIVRALNEQIAKLKSGNLSADDKALALKMVIHLVGDMHQPMHMGHLSDLGGNKVVIKSFGRETKLHGYWDSEIVEFVHKWSHSEWQYQIDRATAEQQAAIVAGTIEDWAKETFAIATAVYEDTPAGKNVSYDYGAKWSPVIEQQLLKGGLRLAAVLNSIF